MKQFLRLYAWGVEVKLYMSIYTAAVVFFQGITEVLQGRYAISVWIMLEMLLVSFVFAAIQYAVLPAGNWSSKKGLAVWVVCANVLYIGGALVFGWFPGVPLWGDILLIAMLVHLAFDGATIYTVNHLDSRIHSCIKAYCIFRACNIVINSTGNTNTGNTSFG